MSNAKLSQGAAYCRATLYPLDIGQIVAVSLLPSLCHIHPLKCGNMKKKKKKKCWQCKKYTVTIYKNEFGGYSETCSNKCGPALLGKQLISIFQGV